MLSKAVDVENCSGKTFEDIDVARRTRSDTLKGGAYAGDPGLSHFPILSRFLFFCVCFFLLPQKLKNIVDFTIYYVYLSVCVCT